MKFNSAKINIGCDVILFSWERYLAPVDKTRISDVFLSLIGCRVSFLGVFQAVFWFLFSCLPGLARPACDWFKFVTKFTQLQVGNPRRVLGQNTVASARGHQIPLLLSSDTHLWVRFVGRSNTQHASMKPQSAKSGLNVEESLRSTATTASSISRGRATRSSSASHLEQGFIYNMSDCYERLRAMVPHIPANRRMSKVEILQHVIDYIQDLESALELPHLQMSNFVKDSEGTSRVPLSTISYNRWVTRYVDMLVLWIWIVLVSQR